MRAAGGEWTHAQMRRRINGKGSIIFVSLVGKRFLSARADVPWDLNSNSSLSVFPLCSQCTLLLPCNLAVLWPSWQRLRDRVPFMLVIRSPEMVSLHFFRNNFVVVDFDRESF